MIVNNKYNLTLIAPFGTLNSLKHAKLTGLVSLSVAIKSPGQGSNVVDTYSRIRHSLPEQLRALDLQVEKFYIFEMAGDRTVVIPKAFVWEGSIAVSERIVKNVEITADSQSDLELVKKFFTDNSIQAVFKD